MTRWIQLSYVKHCIYNKHCMSIIQYLYFIVGRVHVYAAKIKYVCMIFFCVGQV